MIPAHAVFAFLVDCFPKASFGAEALGDVPDHPALPQIGELVHQGERPVGIGLADSAQDGAKHVPVAGVPCGSEGFLRFVASPCPPKNVGFPVPLGGGAGGVVIERGPAEHDEGDGGVPFLLSGEFVPESCEFGAAGIGDTLHEHAVAPGLDGVGEIEPRGVGSVVSGEGRLAAFRGERSMSGGRFRAGAGDQASQSTGEEPSDKREGEMQRFARHRMIHRLSSVHRDGKEIGAYAVPASAVSNRPEKPSPPAPRPATT